MEKSNRLITPHSCFLQLGKSNKQLQESYNSLFQQKKLSNEELTELRLAANKSQVLRKNIFQTQIEHLVGRIVITAIHGGDRKSQNYCKKTTELTPC